MLTLLTLWTTLLPTFEAARKNPNPKTLTARNTAIAFMLVAMLVSGGYALGEELAKRDRAADSELCKP